MKAVVAAFNQEKALVGSFSVLTNLQMELFQALHVTRDVRGTISRHIIPLPDQSRPLQSPPDMFRDEQSLRYPANRWNTGIICNICTGLLWRRRRILHPNYSQMILCGKHPSGPELCSPSAALQHLILILSPGTSILKYGSVKLHLVNWNSM